MLLNFVTLSTLVIVSVNIVKLYRQCVVRGNPEGSFYVNKKIELGL